MESETTPETTPTSSTPSSVLPSTSNHHINFRELKKELKDIPKLTKENLDIKSWSSELHLWKKCQHITDPETIFMACLLTSIGEPRQVIQDLEDLSAESEEESDDEEEEVNSKEFPSLEEVVEGLETFYGTKEDQNVLLRELRALKIKRNEKVKDFNIRYRTLYLKLDKKKRKRISVFDYADSLRNNREAWKKVSLKDNISLNRAFTIAEKVDRLDIRGDFDNFSHTNVRSTTQISYTTPNKLNYNKTSSHTIKKPEKDTVMENLTRQMKNLKISTCFFCGEPGHYQQNCSKLNAIIQENKKRYYENKPLNH